MTDSKRKVIISALWLLACYCAVCVYAAKCGLFYIDADMSSELVLSKLLSKEHAVLSPNWYYSSELRVLNTQLVYAPLFSLFSDWQIVRAIGTAILLGIMVLCSIFFSRSLGLARAGAYVAAGVLLLPLSGSYTYSVLQGVFYVPHVCISFLLFGIIFRYLDGGKKTVWALLGAALAFVAGLGGVRQVFVFTLPAFLTAVLLFYRAYKAGASVSTQKSFLVITLVMLAASGVGCVVNRVVLQDVYAFCNYGENTYGRDVLFSAFSTDGLAFFIDSVMELLGYHLGGLFSGFLIYNLLFALILLALFLSVKKLLEESETPFAYKATALFFLVALSLLALIYCFTDLDRVSRYCVPVVVFAFPILLATFERFDERPLVRVGVVGVFAVLLVFCSANTYRVLARSDANAEIRAVVDYLSECGYDEGYSSFWSGNIITELSDGDIEMHIVSTDMITSADGLQYVYPWLQEKSHDTDTPARRFFLIMKSFESEACELTLEPELVTATYVLYGFDDFAEFEALYK